MSFPYKNPISPSQLIGQQSLERTKTYGTNYSILSTGGYMEVFSLNDLLYTIPPSTFGPIEYSGNSIPITFSKGSGTTFSYDTLTLHPDNISSGRRKLGMMVYVYEENQLYQFIIDNYETLWNNAMGSTGTTIISDFGTTIKADSPENITFINNWTANTIDGVGGETYSSAVWKKLTSSGGGGSGITGGTFDKNTGTLTLGSTGGTITITGFTDTYTTGGTFSSLTNTLELYDNSGNTISISGFSSTFTGNTSATCITDLYVENLYGCSPINVNDLLIANSGITTTSLIATTISATTYQNLPPNYGSFGITIDGGGSEIVTGKKGYLTIPYAGTITGWQLISNTIGSCVIDVWKTSVGNIPTVLDTITGTEKPTLSSQQINSDLNLSTWTTSVSQYDVFAFNVDSTSGLGRVNLSIYITKQ